jgi:hypothetical protein
MARGIESGYVYHVERGFAGPGMEVWRWSITRIRDGQMVCTGVSLSEKAATNDALVLIRSRAASEDPEQPKDP